MQGPRLHRHRGWTEVPVEHRQDSGAHAAGSADLTVPRGRVATSSLVLTFFLKIILERHPCRGVAGVRGEARRILGQEGHALLLLEGEGPPGLRGEPDRRRAVCGAASSHLRGFME